MDGLAYSGWATYIAGNTAIISNRTNGINDLGGSTTVTDDQWHLIVGQYDSVSLTSKLYIDGKLEAESDPINAFNPPASYPLAIGSDGVLWPWHGLLEEFKIWNYAIDPYEIAHLYTDAMPGETICSEQTGLSADLNGDCRVDLVDISIIASEWLNCNSVPDCM